MNPAGAGRRGAGRGGVSVRPVVRLLAADCEVSSLRVLKSFSGLVGLRWTAEQPAELR